MMNFVLKGLHCYAYHEMSACLDLFFPFCDLFYIFLYFVFSFSFFLFFLLFVLSCLLGGGGGGDLFGFAFLCCCESVSHSYSATRSGILWMQKLMSPLLKTQSCELLSL